MRLVIKKASDVEIWRAVIDLITSLSRISPPASVPPSFDSTPIIRPSASLQVDEQTEKLLNILLFDEIKHCTYRNVKGFFAKYFEGQIWSMRSKEIYDTVKDRHVGGRWVDFPDPAVQDDVLTWLFQFQKEHLSDAPGVYYTTQNTTHLAGAEAQRQLDLFVKGRSNACGETHDWNEVLVIGEHKQSTNDLKPMLLQLSRYMRDVYQVVAGIVALFLRDRGRDQVDPSPLALLIYAELTAGISILLALNWLFSLKHHLQHFSVDFCMSVMWFIVFGLFIKYMGATSCATKPVDWSRIVSGGLCNQFKTCEAFTFLAAIIWIVDALMGFWVGGGQNRSCTQSRY